MTAKLSPCIMESDDLALENTHTMNACRTIATVILFMLSTAWVYAADALHITRITPEGVDVPAGRQIIFEFNQPVVPLGAMQRDSAEIPITITPKLDCQWRWLNATTLSCELSEQHKLQAATRYTLEVQPKFKSYQGAVMSEPHRHTFVTLRPDVEYTDFKVWQSPSVPVFEVRFNQPVTRQSVRQHVFFKVGKTQPQKMQAYVEPLQDQEQSIQVGRDVARRGWLITPVQALPADSDVALSLEAGLQSALGSEPSANTRDVVTFATFPPFQFLGLRCEQTKTEGRKFFTAQEANIALCDPMRSITLTFSAPVLRQDVVAQLTADPNLVIKTDDAEMGWSGEDWRRYSLHQRGRTYEVSLPDGVKAAQLYKVNTKAPDIEALPLLQQLPLQVAAAIAPLQTAVVDSFGRVLEQPIAFDFTTDHRRPNVEIVHNIAVLEQGIDTEVPLYVNNVQQAEFHYDRITRTKIERDLYKTYTPAPIQDVQFAIPFQVRELLQGQSGVVYGKLSTEPKINRLEYAGNLFAQVTPFQVHAKLGHFNSLVWVTEFATGKPVADAQVSVYVGGYQPLNMLFPPKVSVYTDAQGMAILPGSEQLDPDLMLTRYRYESKAKSELFVRVDKGQDMALLPLNADFTIETYRLGVNSVDSHAERYLGHLKAWGMTAQGVYRAGDTIQYKFYVRNQDNKTLTSPPRQGYTLKIIDPKGQVVDERKSLRLSEWGAYDGEFAVSKQAAMGWYCFELTTPQSVDTERAPSSEDEPKKLDVLKVLVSDFVPAPFHVTQQLNGQLFHHESPVQIDTQAQLHAGGPYTEASVRATAVLEPKTFTSSHPLAREFSFASIEPNKTMDSQQVYQGEGKLNGEGLWSTSFKMPESPIWYGQLRVESSVQDERGGFVTAQHAADYVGVDRLVGVKAEWTYNARKPAHVQTLVVNTQGQPVAGDKLVVSIEQYVTKAARVKSAGNAYVTEFNSEWVQVSQCDLEAKAEPVDCVFTPQQAGGYRAVATVKDSEKRTHTTSTSLWVTGEDALVWQQDNEYALVILPEKSSYQVGEEARYLVKNPYPGAQALITIERYGVLDRFVQTFDNQTPIIRFPIKPEYMPGFYLSVVVTSPRVAKPIDDQQVDLGKPTFRMGYVAVPVFDDHKAIQVSASTNKAAYKPREQVTVQLQAKPKTADSHEPIELAVAVLDEAVFDLIKEGRSYFDPYQGFYSLDALDMRNYSLLMRLVGRQKFEKKGANPGGDGGGDLSVRNLFKFVSYWNPSLQVDTEGRAHISFQAPDNLTGWRVLAIATTPSDRMGLGEAKFKVNKMTEIRPVMPNQLNSGDQFQAGFSVMNRSDKPRKIQVTINAEGALEGDKTQKQETLSLQPYQRVTVTMSVKTNARKPEDALRFTARAGDASDHDAMQTSVPVRITTPVEVAAQSGSTTESNVRVPVAVPADIRPEVSALSVQLSATILQQMDGAFEYMKNYPYACWEQRLTKAWMAALYQGFKPYLADSQRWDDSKTLPKAMLNDASAFQTEEGGMAYWGTDVARQDPYLSAYTALAFQALQQQGYAPSSTVEQKLHGYLTNLLKNNSRHEAYDDSLNNTVRAMALAALAQAGKLNEDDVMRFAPAVKTMALVGKAYFVQALLAVDRPAMAELIAREHILKYAKETASGLSFEDNVSDAARYWLLSSDVRNDCVMLDTLTKLAIKAKASWIADKPLKLAQGIVAGRKQQDHWSNTQENVFCTQALYRYSRQFEAKTPDLAIRASWHKRTLAEGTLKAFDAPPITGRMPLKESDAGKQEPITFVAKGEGRWYYTTRLHYQPATPPINPVLAGFEVHREYSVWRDKKWQLLRAPNKVKQGDLVRVDLFVSNEGARYFVVVDDPVPGGLEPVNRDLATSSMLMAEKAESKAAEGSRLTQKDWLPFQATQWSFYHRELRHDRVNFFADYLASGNYHLSYVAQVITPGEFTVPGAHAEQMYQPEVYGRSEPAKMVVE